MLRKVSDTLGHFPSSENKTDSLTLKTPEQSAALIGTYYANEVAKPEPIWFYALERRLEKNVKDWDQ